MNCEQVRELLDGYGDGEIDLVNHVEIELHLEVCAECSRIQEGNVSLRSALADESLYFRAPQDLRKKIKTSLKETGSDIVGESWWPWRWTAAFAGVAVFAAILIATFVVLRSSASSEELLAKEIVSAHVRSMMVNHLTDVPSTDQHTVKPWFEGKLDFCAPGIDRSAKDFAVVGGRLECAAGGPVARTRRQRRQHFINLFVFPSPDEGTNEGKMLERQGFNLIHWSKSGMTFWAISDLNLNELQEFAQDLQS